MNRTESTWSGESLPRRMLSASDAEAWQLGCRAVVVSILARMWRGFESLALATLMLVTALASTSAVAQTIFSSEGTTEVDISENSAGALEILARSDASGQTIRLVVGGAATPGVDTLELGQNPTPAGADYIVSVAFVNEAQVPLVAEHYDVAGGYYQYTFPEGSGQGFLEFAFLALEDTVVEPDEIIELDAFHVVGSVLHVIDEDLEINIVDTNSPLNAVIENAGEVQEGEPMEFDVQLISNDRGATLTSSREVTIPYGIFFRDSTTSLADFTGISDIRGSIKIAGGSTMGRIVLQTKVDIFDDTGEEVFVRLDSEPTPNEAVERGVDYVGRGRILDGPRELSVADATAAEGENLEFVVTTQPVSFNDIMIDYEITGVSAVVSGRDSDIDGVFNGVFCGSPLSGSVRIPAEEESAVVAVCTVEDDESDEEDETIELAISKPSARQETEFEISGDGATATGTILNRITTPTISISAVVDEVAEGSGTAAIPNLEFLVEIAPTPDGEIWVPYTVTGTATADDYVDETVNGSDEDSPLKFSPNQTTKRITVSTVQDRVKESDETVVVTLQSPIGPPGSDGGAPTTAPTAPSPPAIEENLPYTLQDSTRSATGTIKDDDEPSLTLELSNSNITETGGTASVTVRVTNQTVFSTAQTINLLFDGEATLDSDYTLDGTAPYSLTLPANQTMVSATLMAITDQEDEGDGETVVVSAVFASSGDTVGSAQTLTITDDDSAVMSFSVAPLSIDEVDNTSTAAVAENVAMAEIRIINGVALTTDLNFTLTFSGEAEAGVDYVVSGAGTAPYSLTIPAGSATASAAATIMAMNDAIYEPGGETVEITVSHANTSHPLHGTTQTLMIADDDIPSLSFTVSPNRIDENGGEAVVKIEVINGKTYLSNQRFSLTLGGTAEIQVGGVQHPDYTLAGAGTTAPFGLLLPEGQTMVEATITAIEDNFDEETGEEITVQASHDEDGDVQVGTEQTVTIADNDTAELSFGVSPSNIAEDGGIASVEVSVVNGKPFSSVQTFSLTFAGEAELATDYTVTGYEVAGTGSVYTLPLAARASTAQAVITALQDQIDEGTGEAVDVSATHNGAPVGQQETVTIDDDDSATVMIGDAPATPEGGNLVFPVRINPVSESVLRIDYTLDGTDVDADDFDDDELDDLAGTLEIPPRTGLTSITLPTFDDSVDEINEVVTLSFTGAATGSVTGTINDNDNPIVTVRKSPPSVVEGSEAVFTLERAGILIEPLRVSFSVVPEGDMLTGAALPTTAMFGVNSETVEVTIETQGDSLDEANGSLVLTLVDGDSYNLGSENTRFHEITIMDDDQPVVTVEKSPESVSEGEMAVFTLNRVGDLTGPLEVSFGVVETGDILPITERLPSAATFGAGLDEVTVPINTDNDEVDEANGNLKLTLTMDSSYILGEAEMRFHDIAVLDDDSPLVTVVQMPSSVVEGEDAIFTLERVGDTSVELTVRFSVARNGDILPPGATLPTEARFREMQPTATVTISTHDDEVDEMNGSLQLTLTANGYRLGDSGTETHTITVEDDDTPPALPVLMVERSPASVDEGQAAEFTINRTVNTVGALTARFSIDLDGSVLPEGTELPSTASFADGVATAMVIVNTDDDTVDEANGSITLTLTDTLDYDLGAENTRFHEIEVIDDDLPVVTVQQTPVSVDEGNDAVFTLNRAGDTSVPLLVQFTVESEGSYLRAGETLPSEAAFAVNSENATVAIRTDNDSVDEVDGSFQLTLTASTEPGAVYGLDSDPQTRTHTIDVLDDDLPLVTVLDMPETVEEGAAAVFTLNRVGVLTEALTVSVNVSVDGDILPLSASLPTSVAFEAGSNTASAEIMTDNDEVDEADGGLTLALSETDSRFVRGDDDTRMHTITVTDNDDPVISVVEMPVSVEEGEIAEFRLRREGVLTETLVVSFTISPTGGMVPSGGSLPSEATFGEDNNTVTVGIQTLENEVDELNGSVTLTLIDGANYDLSETEATMHTIDVIDEDNPVVTVERTLEPESIEEGTTAMFTLRRVGVASVPLVVNFAIDRTGDILPIGAELPTSETFAVGSETVEVSIPTHNDEEDEENGSLELTLSASGVYNVGDESSHSIAVTDNDLPVVAVSNLPNTVVEGATAEFTLNRDGVVSGELTVSFQIDTMGEILSASTVLPSEVTFAVDSETAMVDIPTVDDNVDEEDGSIQLTLVALAGQETYRLDTTDTSHTITVTDNDDPAPIPVVTVAGTPLSEIEGNPAVFTLNRTGDTTAALTVQFMIESEGSILPSNPNLPEETTFGAGSSTAEVRINTLGDGVDEADGSITLTLEDGGAYDLGASGTETHTIEIMDDDLPVVAVVQTPDEAVMEGMDAVFRLTRAGDTSGTLTASFTFEITGSILPMGAQLPPNVVFAAGSSTAEVTISTEDDGVDEANGQITLTLAEAVSLYERGANTHTILLTDNDFPVVTVSQTSTPVQEGADVVFTLIRDGDMSVALSVSFMIDSEGNFFSGTTLPSGATFDMDSSTVLVTIPTEDDMVDEVDGNFVLTLTDEADYNLGMPATHTIAVTDEDLPVVTVSQSPASVTEGGNAEFTLNRVGVLAGALTVAISISSTGDIFPALATLPSSATFTAGSATATVSISTQDDDLDEEDGSIEMTLSTGGTVFVRGSDNWSHTIVVADNDLPSVSVAQAPVSVEEGEPAVFTLERVGVLTDALTVSFEIDVTGDVIPPSFQLPDSASFDPDSAEVMVSIETDNDFVDEANGSIQLTVPASGSGFVAGAANAMHIIEVRDNDFPIVTVEQSPDSVFEGAPAVFTLTRAGVTSAELTVNFSVASTGDILPESTTFPTSATFSENSESAVVSIATDDDGEDEEGGSLTLTLADGGTYNLGSSGTESHTIAVADNDTPPEIPIVTVEQMPTAVVEGGNAVFTISRTGDTAETLSVDFAISRFGDILPSGATLQSSATFGANSATATVTVTTQDDSADEADGSLTLLLRDRASYDLGAPGTESHTIAVTDNDDPVVSVSDTPTSVDEGDDVVFTLRRVGDTSVMLAVEFTIVSDGSFLPSGETPPSDATFAINSDTVTVTISTENDSVDEENGSFELTLADGTDYDLDSNATMHSIAVADDDLQVITVDKSITSVEEGSPAIFTLRRAGIMVEALSVSFSMSSSGDVLPTGATLPTSVTFAVNEPTALVRIETQGDMVDEPNGSLTLTLRDLSDYDLGATGTELHTIAVTDDDQPVVTVAQSPSSVVEGSPAIFTLNRAGDTAETLIVAFEIVVDGDVLPANARLPASAEFATGFTTTMVMVPTQGDLDDELDGSLKLTLTDQSDYRLGEHDTTHTIVVTDDELPSVSVQAQTSSIMEGDDAVFVLTRLGVVSHSLTVSFAIAEVGSFSGDGSELPASATFAANSATATVTIGTVDDGVDEVNGSISLVLQTETGSSYALGSPSTASISIADNDTAPQLSVSATGDGAVNEGEPLVFEVTLRPAATVPVTVNYVTGGGTSTAMAPDDYREITDGTLTFPPGTTTLTIEIQTVDDNEGEDTETVRVLLSGPMGALTSIASGQGVAYGTILDNDNEGVPVISLREGPVSAPEGSGLVFPVNIAPPSQCRIRIPFTVIEGSAKPGIDYVTTFGELIFEPGEMSKDIFVDTIADADFDEEAEDVTVQLGEPEYIEPPVCPLSTAVLLAANPIRHLSSSGVIVNVAPTLIVQVGPSEIFEGQTTSINISTDQELGIDQQFNLQFTGSATPETDYVIELDGEAVPLDASPASPATYSLTLPARETSLVVVFRTVSDDVAATGQPREGNEYVEVTVLRVSDSETNGPHRIDIRDIVESELIEARRKGAAAILRYHIDRFNDLSTTVAISRLKNQWTRDLQASGVDGVDEVTTTMRLGDSDSAAGGEWASWATAAYGQIDGEGYGEVYDAYGGLDILSASRRYVLGWLVGYEDSDWEKDGIDYATSHLQAGAYGAAVISGNLTVDGAFTWGVGSPRVSLRDAHAKFRSQRVTARVDLNGQAKWQPLGLVIDPRVGALYARENLAAFRDNVGGVGPTERLTVSRLQAGMRVRWNGERSLFIAEPLLRTDRQNLKGEVEVDTSVAFESRLRLPMGDFATFDVNFGVDGIGIANDYRSFTGGFTVRARF